MRICLFSRNDHVRDPRARALRSSLLAAGHEVDVLATGRRPAAAPEPSFYLPARVPAGKGSLRRFLRRSQPEALRRLSADRRLSKALADRDADLVYPAAPDLVSLAAGAVTGDTLVAREPTWPDAGARDLVDRAPVADHPAGCRLASEGFHAPDDDRRAWVPAPGRLAGERFVLVYRRTARNPGRYLEDAIVRSGATVERVTGEIDLGAVDPATTAVVFVECPYPPAEVRGEAPCPVVFWVHHGEHHLPANLRLRDRYRADGILLAHSWHLAHRFGRPVLRFPFAVAPHFAAMQRPWRQRSFDVALVGSHLRGGGPYARRQELVRRFEGSKGLRTAFLEGISPAEMAATYADARVVLNEGGVRHLPITMRVFEALAGGALLASDPVPGLDQLLTPGRHYLELDRGDPVTHVEAALADPEVGEHAAEAAEWARGRHTYDHRVDELVAFVRGLQRQGTPPPQPQADALAALIDTDVEVQRIVADQPDDLVEQLPDRWVYDLDHVRERLAPHSFEAVVLHRAELTPDDEPLLRAARRYLYLRGRAAGLEELLGDLHPGASIQRDRGLVRVDLHASGYRVPTHEAAPQ